MNAFFIFPASAKRSISGLFSTHPPIEKRLAALPAPRGASCRARGAA